MEKRNFDEDVYDDCWVHIFSRLPLKKRIQVEGVSRKWKRLMPYNNIFSVDLNDFVWPKDRMIETQFGVDILRHLNDFVQPEGRRTESQFGMKIVRQEDTSHVLEVILSRCGHNLCHLVFGRDTSKSFPSNFVFGLNGDLADLLVEMAPNLVTLDLSSCVLSLGCFPTLARLDKLEELQLSGGRHHDDFIFFSEDDFSTHIQDKGAIKMALGSTIQNLPALKKLHLGRSLDDVCPPIRNAGLRELKMSGGTLTALDIQYLVRYCPSLESLDLYLYAVNLSHLQLGALGGLHHLRSLSLYFAILRSEDLAAICEGCPKLEKLNLLVVLELTSCADLWRLYQLKHLGIFTPAPVVRPVNNAVLASVARYGLLESVSLRGAKKLTNDGLHNLATHCPNLTKLEIRGIKAITDEGIEAVLENCKSLERLDVSETRIGDGTMVTIGVNGVRLTELDAVATLVTEDGISHLVEERLKRLAEGEQLVALWVRVSCGCSIPEEDLDAVSLEVEVLDIDEDDLDSETDEETDEDDTDDEDE